MDIIFSFFFGGKTRKFRENVLSSIHINSYVLYRLSGPANTSANITCITTATSTPITLFTQHTNGINIAGGNGVVLGRANTV